LKSFKLFLEEARISLSFERKVASKSRVSFPGVTCLQLVESILDLSSTFKTVFPDIFLPEAILIFCLGKQVASGTYAFGGAGNTDQNVFKDHCIEYLDFSFDNKRFSLKEPHFGKFCSDRLTLKQLVDHHRIPMFGIRPDTVKLNLAAVRDGGGGSAFPHIYIPLRSSHADKELLVPPMDDGSCISKNQILKLPFNSTNKIPSPAPSTCATPYTPMLPCFWMFETNIFNCPISNTCKVFCKLNAFVVDVVAIIF
jgi:hypothetical protein